MKTISIIALKGGVCKTTTAQSLAYYLRAKGKRVLLIDADPQANLTKLEDANEDITLYQIIKDNDLILSKEARLNDIISANHTLSMLNQDKEVKPTALKDALKLVSKKYDYCIIDNNGTLTTTTQNTLTASDFVLIPTEAHLLSFLDIEEALQTISTIKKYFNKDLKLIGVFLVKYKERVKIQQKVKQDLETMLFEYNICLLDTYIHEATAIQEAQALHTNIIDYAKNSKVAKDYQALTEEILELIEK